MDENTTIAPCNEDDEEDDVERDYEAYIDAYYSPPDDEPFSYAEPY